MRYEKKSIKNNADLIQKILEVRRNFTKAKLGGLDSAYFVNKTAMFHMKHDLYGILFIAYAR